MKLPAPFHARALARESGRTDDRPESPFVSGPFVSFSYSFHEVSTVGGRTRVRSRRMRLEDGSLQTEEFEGTLDAAAYERAVADAQRRVMDQTAALMRQMFELLPFSGRGR